MVRFALFSLAVIGVAAVIGCGDGGPKLGDVEGTITFDGRPVPNAQVLFVPTDVKPANPSYGLTDAQGHYKLLFTRDKSGAVVATHSVKITVQKYSKEERDNMRAAGQEVSDDVVALPKKYNEEGTLSAKVVGGKNTIDFPLAK